jgi:hypothetical protein
MLVIYCIKCGLELGPDHSFCPRCGAERWTPGEERRAVRPPPGAGSQPFDPAPPRTAPAPGLRWLPFVFGAGAVFWLIQLAQFAAVVAAPAGRDQMRQALVTSGVTANGAAVVAVEAALIVLFELAAVALHAAAFYGLRRFRPWGWISAVIVAAGWSLVLVGIPLMVVLLRRTTRQRFGIS